MTNRLSRETRVANAGRGWSKRRAREAEQALMTVQQAAARGIDRLHDPRWAGPMDHLKIDIFDGLPGPWVHLYSPMNWRLNGIDPVNMLITQLAPDAKGHAYKGPLPDSDAYRAEVAAFERRVDACERSKP